MSELQRIYFPNAVRQVLPARKKIFFPQHNKNMLIVVSTACQPIRGRETERRVTKHPNWLIPDILETGIQPSNRKLSPINDVTQSSVGAHFRFLYRLSRKPFHRFQPINSYKCDTCVEQCCAIGKK